MKRLFILLLLLTQSAAAAFLTYDSTRRMPFFTDATFTRDEYDWWVKSTKQDSRLFLNGVYQSQETGTNDIKYVAALGIQPDASGVKIGTLGVNAGHDGRVMAIITNAAPGCVQMLAPYGGGDQQFSDSVGITNCVTNGCVVVVFSTGYSFLSDNNLSNACRWAESQGVILCCPNPNVEGDMDDELVDYPYTFARTMNNILPVTATDRNGAHLNPSGTGTNGVAAPGRTIIGDGTYGSGCSYATPIAAALLALHIKKYPGQTAPTRIARMLATSDGSLRRINAFRFLQPVTTGIGQATVGTATVR